MNHECHLRITFNTSSRADANLAASELREAILEETGDDTVVRIEKDDPNSQDAGATLALLFGTPAAIAIARGIQSYIATRGTSLEIRTANGNQLVAHGDAAIIHDPAALVSAMVATASDGRKL